MSSFAKKIVLLFLLATALCANAQQYTEYQHEMTVMAVKEFLANLRGDREDKNGEECRREIPFIQRAFQRGLVSFEEVGTSEEEIEKFFITCGEKVLKKKLT